MNNHREKNLRFIRASFDDDTIIVYQAFNRKIAIPAVENQLFNSPFFKTTRMTWIKPSFLWMMYRTSWNTKETDKHILRISIRRTAFDEALRNSCLSKFDVNIHRTELEWRNQLIKSDVRVQWDPERDVNFDRLNEMRTIQIGLSGEAVQNYANNWIVHIEDITSFVKSLHTDILVGNVSEVISKLPFEKYYPLDDEIRMITSATR